MFDRRAAPYALGGIALAVVAGRTLAAVFRHMSLPVASEYFVLWTAVFLGLWITCRYVSRRFGTGNPWADFGFRWRPSDLWRGAVAYVVATVLGGIATSPWLGHTDRFERLYRLSHASWAAFAVFACAAVVGAPVFEELAFRGMLQRTLAERSGQRRALLGQALAFAGYHFAPWLGWENIPFMVGVMCFGIVMGWLARRLRRLGAGATAHVLANSLAVLARSASR